MNRKVHLVQTVVVCNQQVDFAHAVYNKIAVLQIGKTAYVYIYAMRQVRHAVAQVLTFAYGLLFICIYKQQFVGYALHGKAVRDVRADMPKSYNGNAAGFHK